MALAGPGFAVLPQYLFEEVAMIIQGLNSVAASYAAIQASPVQRQTIAAATANISDRVSISAAAKAMLAESGAPAAAQAVQDRLDAIKAKSALERTADDTEFLIKNDKRLAEIVAKDEQTRTADEIDYMQKAGGFVNTMAELSPTEKAMYDDLVAHGNWEAAKGLSLVGMSRIGMGGQQVTLPNGRVFDPATTEVTADNIRNLFQQMFVDDSGQSDHHFEALASYLERRETAEGNAARG